MRHIWKRGQRGFTLIELVVVIAILGVLAAIAVPMVSNYLGSAKERAYTADKSRIQAAVDAYYSEPRNVKYLGARQYPIKGMDSTGDLNTWEGGNAGADLTNAVPRNPFLGTQGGNPRWRDSGDGLRTEENLIAEAESLVPGSSSGWYVVMVTRQGTDYVVDSRDYLIDFTKLTVDTPLSGQLKLLDKVPASASTDNGGAATGSYSWYVDADGKVNSVYFHFPTNGQLPNPIGADNRGYVSGVYP